MVATSLLPSAALFARGLDDLGWVLIALASFAVWIYNQIKKANEEKATKQGPPQPNPPPPRPRTQPSGGQPRAQQPPVRGQPQASRPQPPARGGLAERPTFSQGSAAGAPAQPEGVASHVRRHLDEQEFEQRAESLGQLGHLSTDVDEHVHAAFDHQVSTINDQGAVTEGDLNATPFAAATAEPSGIGEMLADPDNLRNAVILQEILRLPKWD